MEYRRFGDTYAVRIDCGEEIMENLKCLCERENITFAKVEAIGAANHAAIGVYDLETQSYHRKDLEGFLEIASLAGNVTTMNGKTYIHLHTALADQQHVVYAGHVLEMRVGATCEMFVSVLNGTVDRARDEKLGINLWKF